MKTPIAITLIIAGALLILAPAATDYLHQRQIAELLAANGAGRVTLLGGMSELYSFGCWLTGSLMIGLTIRLSVGLRRQEPVQLAEPRAS